MAVELRIPESGESITEAQIGEWLKSEGDTVKEDEIVVEIETDKASMELPSPASGVLSRIIKRAGETVEVGDVIAYIEKDGEDRGTTEAKAKAKTSAEAEQAKDEAAKDTATPEAGREAARERKKRPRKAASKARSEDSEADEEEKEETEEEVEEKADHTGKGEAEEVEKDSEQAQGPDGEEETAEAEAEIEVEPRVMPAARRALAEHGLRADEVEGTGPGGRVLKEDVLRHVEGGPREPEARRTPPESHTPHRVREEERVPMSLLRRRIADRLVEVQQTAALLTTFNEIDLSAVMDLRKNYGEQFREAHGVKLGFMSFFVKATIEALKRVPAVNAEISERDIVYHNYYDIGVAVGTDRGLVVPVVRDADLLSFAEIEKTIADLARRAQEKKLDVEELQGGTFTISNGGVYGSLLSTPIVNPPQSGILGLHAIQDRPVVREGQIVSRPMMYVALTYDHRIVDGKEAVTFLRHVKEVIETPARMLMEI